MSNKVHDAFFRVPANVAPSTKVRYWGEGIITFAFSLIFFYPILLYLMYLIPGSDLVPFGRTLKETIKGFFYVISGGGSFQDTVSIFIADMKLGNTWGMGLRIGVAALITFVMTFFLCSRALTPRNNVRHISGARILEGKEAIEEARRRSITKEEAENDPYSLYIHPDYRISKKQTARSFFFIGSVGSGKSVSLKYIADQVIHKLNAKLLIYDVKGDFTSIFRKPIIVSPFDRRSYYWDISCDVKTLPQANSFAQSMIPANPGEKDPFWSNAAREILVGCIITLQIQKPSMWGWYDLSQSLLKDADELLVDLKEHYPQAIRYIEAGNENVTVQGIISNLSDKVKFVHDLARAWPVRKQKRRFSIVEWCQDNYQGRKQLIVQGGPDKLLVRAYISAMVNIATLEIIYSDMPDNEKGRHLGFMFDEMSSIGEIQVEDLISKGRSKGVVMYMAVQDMAQLEKIYGKLDVKSFNSMTGGKVICQVQAGDTRDELAQLLGKKKEAWFSYGDKDTPAHEESKNVVSPAFLTDELGFKETKRLFGKSEKVVNVLVQIKGDLLKLAFPIKEYPVVRLGQDQADWVKQATTLDLLTKKAPKPVIPDEEQTVKITDEELQWIEKTQHKVLTPEQKARIQEAGGLGSYNAKMIAQILEKNKGKRKVDIDFGSALLEGDDDPFGLRPQPVEEVVEEEDDEEGEIGAGIVNSPTMRIVTKAELDALLLEIKPNNDKGHNK